MARALFSKKLLVAATVAGLSFATSQVFAQETVTNKTVDTNGETYQEQNTSGGAHTRYGGAFWVGEKGHLNVTEGTKFIKNKTWVSDSDAGWDGGAIYVNQDDTATLTIEGAIDNEVQFKENTANYSGGAIAISARNNTPISNAIFTSNTAGNKGGAIYFTTNNDSRLYIKNSAFGGSGETGNSSFGANSDHGGGAIYASNLTSENNTFSYNFAAQKGGAICLAGGINKILNDSFTNNIVEGTDNNIGGGAIYQNGGRHLKIDHSTFTDNYVSNISLEPTTSSSTKGGALYLNPSTASYYDIESGLVDYSVFTGNKVSIASDDEKALNTTKGGAIYVEQPVNIKNSQFINNEANSGSGGAIYANNSIKEFDSNVLTGNKADYQGGALVAPSDTYITNSSFSSNTAKQGGAIYGSVSSIKNSVIDHNIAQEGGGIYQRGTGVTLDNVNMFGNSVVSDNPEVIAQGAAIFAKETSIYDPSITINNSYIYENTGGSTIYTTAGGSIRLFNTDVYDNDAGKGGENVTGVIHSSRTEYNPRFYLVDTNITGNIADYTIKNSHATISAITRDIEIDNDTTNGIDIKYGYYGGNELTINGLKGRNIVINDPVTSAIDTHISGVNVEFGEKFIHKDTRGQLCVDSGKAVFNNGLDVQNWLNIGDSNGSSDMATVVFMNNDNNVGKLEFYGNSTIDLSQDNAINSLNAGYYAFDNYYGTPQVNLVLNADLENGLIDKVSLGDNSKYGKINLLDIVNIIGEDATPEGFEAAFPMGTTKELVFMDKNSTSGTSSFTVQLDGQTQGQMEVNDMSGSYLYELLAPEGKNVGKLRVTRNEGKEVEDVISSTTSPSTRSYILADDFRLNADAPAIGGSSHIILNGIMGGEDGYYQIVGNANDTNHKGFVVSEGQTLDVKNAEINGFNVVSNAWNNGGGFAAVESGTLNVDNVKFNNNNIGTGMKWGAGIHTSLKYGSSTEPNVNIENSEFRNNNAGIGGAISHNSGIMNITNSVFNSNMAGSEGMGSGGAISSGAELYIYSSEFSNNHSESTGGAIENTGNLTIAGTLFENNNSQNGGAIYNWDNSYMNNGTTATIIDSIFKNNNAGLGGAIYNQGATINLVSNQADTLISATTPQHSGAIYNSAWVEEYNEENYLAGIVNLNSASGRTVDIRDGINGTSEYVDKQIININKTNGDLPKAGNVSFGGNVENQTINVYNGNLNIDYNANIADSNIFNQTGGTINIYNGDLNVSSNDTLTNVNLIGGTLHLNDAVISELNFYGHDGRLDTINNAISQTVVKQIGGTNNYGGYTYWSLDADMLNGEADNMFLTSITDSGSVIVDEINLITGVSGSVMIAKNYKGYNGGDLISAIQLADTINFTGDNAENLEDYSFKDGILTLVFSDLGYESLAEAIKDDENVNKYYTLTQDESAVASLNQSDNEYGELVNNLVILDDNTHKIQGGDFVLDSQNQKVYASGITVQGEHTLGIQNVKEISGFINEGGNNYALRNWGVLNISNTNNPTLSTEQRKAIVFKDNDIDIINNGVLNFEDGPVKFGLNEKNNNYNDDESTGSGGITGNGVMNITNAQVILGDGAIIEQRELNIKSTLNDESAGYSNTDLKAPVAGLNITDGINNSGKILLYSNVDADLDTAIGGVGNTDFQTASGKTITLKQAITNNMYLKENARLKTNADYLGNTLKSGYNTNLELTGGTVSQIIDLSSSTATISGDVTLENNFYAGNGTTVQEGVKLSTADASLIGIQGTYNWCANNITNNGIVELSGGTLKSTITGGTLNLLNDISSSAGNLMADTINNYHTLTLTGGTLQKEIAAQTDGLVKIGTGSQSTTVTLNSDVYQPILISGYYGTLKTTPDHLKNTVTFGQYSSDNPTRSDAKLSLTGGTLEGVDLQGLENGTITISDSGIVTINQEVAQKIQIDSGSKLITNADNLLNNIINNNGTLELTGGTLDNTNYYGYNRSLNIAGDVTLGAKVGDNTIFRINSGSLIANTTDNYTRGSGRTNASNIFIDGTGVLDMRSENQLINNITVNNFTVNETAQNTSGLSFDTDLAHLLNDTITVGGTAAGNLNLQKVALASGFDGEIGDTKTLTLFKQYEQSGTKYGNLDNLNIANSSKSIFGDYSYKFEQAKDELGNPIAGQILVTKGEGYDFYDVIHASTEGMQIDSYNFNDNIALEDDLGNLGKYDGQPRTLLLNGNNFSLASNEHEGLTINTDPSLGDDNVTVKNFSSISGFEGTALTNSGTLEIDNVVFENNGTDVLNMGTLDLTGSNSISTISDSETPLGTTNIKSGITNLLGNIKQNTINIFNGAKVSVGDIDTNVTIGAEGDFINNGTLELRGGSISHDITSENGTGNIIIAGDVTNNAVLGQALTINENKSLTSAVSGIDAAVTNNGTLQLTSSTGWTPFDKDTITDAITHDITGNGYTYFNGGETLVQSDISTNVVLTTDINNPSQTVLALDSNKKLGAAGKSLNLGGFSFVAAEKSAEILSDINISSTLDGYNSGILISADSLKGNVYGISGYADIYDGTLNVNLAKKNASSVFNTSIFGDVILTEGKKIDATSLIIASADDIQTSLAGVTVPEGWSLTSGALKANASDITVTNGIINDSLLTFTGGTNTNVITQNAGQAGVIDIIGDTATSGNITQNKINLKGGRFAVNQGASVVANVVASAATPSEYTVTSGDAKGGAIYNAGSISKISGNFTGNKAIAANGTSYGGAIYQDGGSITIADTSFTGNIAQRGGAIYGNNADITIAAQTADVTFANNNSTGAEGGSGYGIETNGGSLTLNADGTNSENFNILTINDSMNVGSALNINSENNKGMVVLNGALELGGATNVKGGTLDLGQAAAGSIFNTVNFTNTPTLSLENENIDILSIAKINGNFNLAIDVNNVGSDVVMDTINLTATGSNSVITISDLYAPESFEHPDTFTYDVITGNVSGVTLALSDEVREQFSGDWETHNYIKNYEYDNDITFDKTTFVDEAWQKEMRESLNVNNDAENVRQLVYQVEERNDHHKDSGDVSHDAIQVLNSHEGERTLSAVSATANKYKVIELLTPTATGTFNITGKTTGSELDLNSLNGFELSNANTILNLEDLTITNIRDGADGQLLSITGENSKANLTNVTIAGINHNAISNAVELNLDGTNSIAKGIVGNGITNILGGSTIIDSINQKQVNIEAGSLEVIDLATTNGVTNKGTLTLKGTANANAISGSGSTVIANDLNNTGLISQAVTVNAEKLLTTSASLLGGVITNNGTVELTGGELANAITGGNITISTGEVTATVANLGGAVNNTSSLLLSGNLNKAISGNGTTIINEALSITSEGSIQGTLDMNNGILTLSGDGSATTYEVNKLINSGHVNIDIDFSNSTPVADSINIATATEGNRTITVDSITKIGNIGESFTVDLLKGQTEGAKLLISEDLANEYAGEIETDVTYESEDFSANIDFDKKTFDTVEYTEKSQKTLSVLNDTKLQLDKVVVEAKHETGREQKDALVKLNTTSGVRSMSATTASSSNTYKLTENLGSTAAGSISVIGKSASELGTLDLDGKTGFELTNTNTTVNLTNLNVTGAKAENGSLINITKESSSANLENVKVAQNTANVISSNGTLGVTNSEVKAGIDNTGSLNLNGTNDITTVSGNGTTRVETGKSTIGTIAQKLINIVSGGILASNSVTVGTGENEGLVNNSANGLELTNGSIEGNVTGSGNIKTSGEVQIVDGSKISQGVNVIDGKLITNADSLNGEVTNGSYVELTGGDLVSAINGGNTNIKGVVSIKDSTGLISSAVEIATNGSLKTNASKVTGTITNNNSLELTGGDIQNTISGDGLTTITGVVTNTTASEISSALKISSGSLTTSASAITSGIENNAAEGLILTGGNIASAITGTGTATISGNVTNTNGNSIDNALNVTGSLATAADKLGGAVTNSGTVELTGGELGQTITGGDITISTGAVTANINKLAGNITNTSTLNLSGDLNKTIGGSGTTKLADNISFLDGAEIAGTLDFNGKTLTLSGDNSTNAYNVGKISSDGTVNIDIDFSGATVVSDAINLTASGSTGTITINNVNAIGDSSKEFNLNVITGDAGEIQIALSDAVKNQFNKAAETSKYYVADEYQANIDFDKTTFDTVEHTKVTQKTIDTQGTSIQYATNTISDEETGVTSKDALATINQNENQTAGSRSLTTTGTNKTYTVGDNLGVTGEGSILVQGADDMTSKLDMNGKNGFVESNANTSVTLKNINVIGANSSDGSLINITNTSSSANLDGVTIADNSANVISSNGTVGIKDSTVNAGVNNGVNGTGVLNLNGTNSIDKVAGDGTTNIETGKSTIGSIAQKLINIVSGGKLASSGNVQSTNGITNNSEDGLELTDGANLASNVTGEGNIKTSGNVQIAEGSTVSQGVKVTSGTLTANASSFGGTVTNTGNVDLTGGELASAINGGNTNINGDVAVNDASGSISGAIEIATNGSLKTNATNVTGAIINNNSLELTGGNIQNTITGTNGTTSITGNVTNTTGQTVTQKAIEIASGGNLSTDADKVTADISVADSGSYTLTGGANSNKITGEGSTIIAGTVTNTADIESKVAINSGKSLETNADNIKNTVETSGTYKVTGGNIAQNVTGNGTTQIAGTVTNSANVSSDVNITSGSLDNTNGQLGNVTVTNGTLTSNANNVSGTVANNGTYDITGGTISNAISGNGDINILDNVINNAVNTTTGKVNVAEGKTLSLGTDSNDMFSSAQSVTLNNGSAINTQNSSATATAINNLVLADGAQATAQTKWGDIINGNAGAGSKLTVTSIDLSKTVGVESAPPEEYTFTNMGTAVALAENIDLANVSSTTYNIVTYDSATGKFAGQKSKLVEAIQNTDAGERATYNMNGNETGGGGILEGTLKVQGNGNVIQTDGTSITGSDSIIIGNGVTAGADLILEDVNLGSIVTNGKEGSLVVNGGNKLEYLAQNGSVQISGSDNSVGIYLKEDGNGTSTVTLNANGGSIQIDDDIISNSVNNIINFNGANAINFSGNFDPLTANVNTTVNRTSGYDDAITYNINGGGTLNYTNDTTLYDASHHTSATLNTINFAGGNLNTVNGVVTDFNIANMSLTGTSNFYADVDLANATMDKFTVSNPVTGGGSLNVAGLNLISDASATNTTVNFTTDPVLMAATSYTGGQGLTAMSPIYKYNVAYDNTTGDFNFNRFATGGYGDYNPGIMASPVAAQLGGYFVQLNSYEQAFNNMDMYMLMTKKEREALKLRNKIASLETAKYDNTKSMYDYNAGWFRPYATFENVPLHNGPKVSNVMYGSFFGGESEMKDLGHGWDGMWGAYIGYNGSHQAYDGVGIYQNGGTLGLVGMAYKDNFFLGGTINTGASAGEASTSFGQDEFAMLMAGAAVKTGYNWELAEGKFIIQPNLQMSYSFVNTFDYTNSAGVRMNSDPLNAIQIEPGVKFIGNLKNGWQPYAGVSMVFNIMDRTHFQANNVSLPNLSVNPYVRYGVGVRKTWGERLTGFFQAFLMNGGRNGVGLQAGFRYAIGKEGSNSKEPLNGKTPELKQTKVSLSSMKTNK